MDLLFFVIISFVLYRLLGIFCREFNLKSLTTQGFVVLPISEKGYTFSQCHQRFFYSCSCSRFDGNFDSHFVEKGIFAKNLNRNGCYWPSKIFFSYRYFTFNWCSNGCLDGCGDSCGSGI